MGTPGNTEMTHIHKFRSLRTKVRRVLVGISIQNQRHAISPQTAHRRKGSWLDKWVPLGRRKRQTCTKTAACALFRSTCAAEASHHHSSRLQETGRMEFISRHFTCTTRWVQQKREHLAFTKRPFRGGGWGHGVHKSAFRVHETMGPKRNDHLACTKRPFRRGASFPV